MTGREVPLRMCSGILFGYRQRRTIAGDLGAPMTGFVWDRT